MQELLGEIVQGQIDKGVLYVQPRRDLPIRPSMVSRFPTYSPFLLTLPSLPSQLAQIEMVLSCPPSNNASLFPPLSLSLSHLQCPPMGLCNRLRIFFPSPISRGFPFCSMNLVG